MSIENKKEFENGKEKTKMEKENRKSILVRTDGTYSIVDIPDDDFGRSTVCDGADADADFFGQRRGDFAGRNGFEDGCGF